MSTKLVSSILVPSIMRIGAKASLCLPEVMSQLGLSKPLIISGPLVIKYGYLEQVTDSLTAKDIGYGLFSNVPADPCTNTVKAALAVFSQGDYDCVVGLGGGSPMDTAKALSLLAVQGGEVRDYIAPKDNSEVGLPVIAIPTTAGTGSEATKVTIITDADNGEKMLLMGRAFLPTAALVDYTLTTTMPYRLTADTGIDSLTHAIEAYVSRKANPFSDSLALSAMKLIYENIREVCNNPDSDSAREAMMLGATQAGMAFSNASVALVHGMSRPIGAHFHVPHGLSNAMLLPAISEFSVSSAPSRYADCARQMGIVPEGTNDTPANRILLEELKLLNEDLSVPTPEEYGIDESSYMKLLPEMAEQALASGSPGNNPCIPTIEQMVKLYQNVYSRSNNSMAITNNPIKTCIA
jgi:alcohol dehydrogenase class IV